MRDLVRGYAAATIDTASTASSAIGTELESFAAALVEHDQLRQVLMDASIPAKSRRAVVADLLEARASSEAASLAGFAVAYERPGEIGPTVQALAELAARAGEAGGAPSVEPPAGRLAARERLRGYAERLFEQLEKREDLDRVEDELYAVARLLDGEQALRQVLADPSVAVASRSTVLEELLAGRAAPATLRLARYVLRAGRTRDLVGTFEWLVELAARERGRRVAEVRTAVPLEADESARLAEALRRISGRTVEIRVILDPSVVGGMLVSVGDLVIDGTVRLRFERLRDVLAQPS